MKGLLMKDLRLLWMQKRFLLIMGAVSFFVAFSMANAAFLFGYLGFLVPLYGLSTLSYDDFDGGMAYLMTLPVSRRQYVAGKYLLCLLLGLAAFALAAALTALANPAELLQTLAGAPLTFCTLALILCLMLPLQLRFGAEKARLVLVAIFALGFGAVYLAGRLGLPLRLPQLSGGQLYLPAFAFTAAAIALSFTCATRFLERKEF